jgi:hypothetical protein
MRIRRIFVGHGLCLWGYQPSRGDPRKKEKRYDPYSKSMNHTFAEKRDQPKSADIP